MICPWREVAVEAGQGLGHPALGEPRGPEGRGHGVAARGAPRARRGPRRPRRRSSPAVTVRRTDQQSSPAHRQHQVSARQHDARAVGYRPVGAGPARSAGSHGPADPARSRHSPRGHVLGGVRFGLQSRALGETESARLRAWETARSSVAEKAAIDPRQLQVVNEWAGRLRLGEGLGGVVQGRGGSGRPPRQDRVRGARLAVPGPARGRVRADDCAWLFFDASKNRSRRWCDMKQGGNRVKARRFHERHAAGPG